VVSEIFSILSLVVAFVGAWSIVLGRRSTTAAVEANERANLDAQVRRRIENLMDVVLEIRNVYSRQWVLHRHHWDEWTRIMEWE